MVICLPFFIFSFVRRKNLPQSIPRTKRIEFVRHRGQWSPFRGILQRSLYPDFLLFQTDRHVSFLFQSCATLPWRLFRGKNLPGKSSEQNAKRLQRSIWTLKPRRLKQTSLLYASALVKFINYLAIGSDDIKNIEHLFMPLNNRAFDKKLLQKQTESWAYGNGFKRRYLTAVLL